MTAIELSNPTVTSRGKKPPGRRSDHRKMQRRLEHYAALGPNCPNGHPWSENAKFNYRGYRSCDACAREKAEKRRNDPMTYTGACPHGHAYTRENTIITHQNGKLCLACLRKPEARPRALKPGEMDAINEISGEGGPKHRGKGIISRVRLIAASFADTPEARELKALLKQNGEAAVGNGRPQYRWSHESVALLASEFAKRSRPEKIANLINVGFDRDFTAGAIYTKANKLGLKRPARIILPKPPKAPAVKALKLPPLTTALRFPVGSLLDRINAAVPRHLPRDHRDDVIGEMALAVYEGRLDEVDIERRVREFVNAGYRRDHDKYGPASLDAPIFADSVTTLGDIVTTGLWR